MDKMPNMRNAFWILLALILLLVVGWAIVDFSLWLVWTSITGLVIGGIGRAIVQDNDDVGLVATILAGVGGSMIGGLLANIFDAGFVVRMLLAVIGAAILVFIIRASRSNSPTR